MVTDFTVKPLGGINPAESIQPVFDEIKRIQEDKKQNAMKAAAATAFESEDPDAINSFIDKYPEMLDYVDKRINFKNKRTKQNAIDSSIEIIKSDKDPISILQDRIKLIIDEGGDPSGTQKLLTEVLKAPPELRNEMVTKEAWQTLALYKSKAEYDQMRQAYGMDKSLSDSDKTNAIAEYQFWSNMPEGPEKDAFGLRAGFKNESLKFKKELEKKPEEHPYITDIMAKGWLPSSRITGPMMQAYEAMAKKSAENGNPLTPQDLYDFQFNALKNRATGQTAGSRLNLARKQNVESAFQLLDDMEVTNKKLNYSNINFLGKLDKFKKGQLNDPLFTEYMTQRADSLFILGNALKQNGLTDKSIEVEEEAFSPTLAPKAFGAWLNTQRRALKRAADEMNRDFKYGIETVSTVPAGQGGEGLRSDPGSKNTTMVTNQNKDSQPSKIKFMGFE